MDTLAKLFGGAAPVRIMRLFIGNPETPFDPKDIRTRANITASAARKEVKQLLQVKLIKKITFLKDVPVKKRGKKTTKKKKTQGFVLNRSFPYLYALRLLLLGSEVSDKKSVLTKLQSAGRVKLVVISGAFLQNDEGRLDLLLVGDSLSHGRLERVLRSIESDLGKELRYAVMDSREFHYRLGMYDKFIRDVFDNPHETLLDKIGI